MASLTDQLGTVNSGKSIINPGPANPSLVGDLAGAATKALPGFIEIGAERDRRTARRQQQEAESALDEFEGAAFKIMRGGAQEALTPQGSPEFVQSGPAPFAPELAGSGLPYDVEAATDDAVRAQRAARQGRMPATRADLQLEAAMDELFTKYPDQRAEIAAYAQSRGLDHYMFRAFREEQDMITAEAEAQRGALTSAFDVAAKNGLVTNNTSLEAGAAIGRQFIANEREAARIQQEADNIRADRTLSIQEQDRQLKENGNKAVSAVIGQASLAIIPLLDSTAIALSAAGTDAERQTVLGEYRTSTMAALASFEARGVAQIAAAGGGEQEINAFKTTVQGYRDSIDSLYTTSFAQNKISVENLRAATGLTMEQAAPIYSRISSLIGPAAANALLTGPDGLVALDPEITQALRTEMTQIDPTTARGTMSLARAISYIRGETPLEDLKAEEAPAYIRANAAAHQGNQEAVIRGDTTSVRPWMNTYGNIVEAASELPPTATSLRSLTTATGLYATRDGRVALEAAFKEDPEYADALAQGGRAASARMLLISRDMPSNGPFGVQYNETNGRFEAVLTRQSYDTWAAAQRQRPGATSGLITPGLAPGGPSRSTTSVPDYETLRRQIPEDITTRLNVMNANLTHLVETDKYDEAIPNTLSARERRALYATGRTPDSLREQSATPGGEWNKIVEGLNGNIQNLLMGTVTSPMPGTPEAPPPRGELQTQVRTKGEALGLEWDFVERLVRKESGWNASAENGTTNARGLFQINDDTPRSIEQNIDDGLNMAKDAQEGAQRVLGREPQGWEVYVMYQQGPGGGAALLDPANANLNAVDVLEKVYGNRRLARQAVTANMGNVNMTAGQFARTIGDYFER